MSPERRRFAVVGGGIAGLATAHRLGELCRERGEPPSLVVLEAAGRFGGLVRTDRVGAALLEAGPDSFLLAKPAGVELCERLGIDGELLRVDAGGGARVLVGGRLRELPPGFLMTAPTRLWPVVVSPLFSPWGKLRMALERFVPPAPARDDESLASFVTRRFGGEVLERAAEPVLASVFMADADALSVSAVLPRFVEMERAFGSVSRGLRRSPGGGPIRPHGGVGFAYPRGGVGRIVERLVERLPEGAARTRTPLRALARDPDGSWRLITGGSTAILADAVVLACPAYASAPALRDVDADLAREVGDQRYASCAIVHLSYRDADVARPLEGFGFFVPRSEGRDLLAASYVSLKYPGCWPSGELLVRCFVGGALRPALAELSEGALVSLVDRELCAILGIRGEPRFARATRAVRSMPQYEVGFPRRAASIARRLASHAGLFLAGGSLGAVGLPDCIRSGEQAAEAAYGHAATRSAG
ncbi:MAG: protoporphyrinogen oxidase [Deltaproteobacteria bacterium]|nr:protoporphyrinogen oxidase [Deltaproteobacteria bacterium]